MSRKTYYINLDLSNPTHAAVAELFDRWGRNKNAFLIEALRPYVSSVTSNVMQKSARNNKDTVRVDNFRRKKENAPAKEENCASNAAPQNVSTGSNNVDSYTNQSGEDKRNRESCFTKEQLADIASAGVNIEEMSDDRFEEFRQSVVEFGMKAENAALLSSFTK